MASLTIESRDSVLRYFESRLRRFGHSYAALGWVSLENQQRRFDTLAGVDSLDGASVLDVGCGLGDFCGYLAQRVGGFDYTGLDLSAPMIQRASERHPSARFIQGDILSFRTDRRFDYVVASGVYNLETLDNEPVMREILRAMFSLCTKGAAATMTGRRGAALRGVEEVPGSVHEFDPEAMKAFCLTLTPSVVLREDYLAGDFALYLRRPG